MRILIIGASRGTGLLAAKLALEKGHQVTTLSRHPEQMQVEHPQLRKIKGDFHDQSAVFATVPSHDAVIITASLSIAQLKQQPDFYSRGTRLVIAAMQAAQVPRIVVLSNLGAGDGHTLLNPLAKLFTYLLIREATADHTRQEQLARDSGLQWSVARPSRLTNGPARGNYQKAVGRQVPGSISRADVADFLLEAATTELWIGKTVNLGR
ncbi:MAG: NAD(P)-dependent oxidoreductase [Steroidobacteraceae bacterium]